MQDKKWTIIKWLNLITFLVMVAVNALANILPINNIGTGEVSDSYFNLFAPAGLTFAIWGVIYLLLGVFSIYQLGSSRKAEAGQKTAARRVGIWFIVSSLANTAWIFCWHYRLIPASMVLMLIVLISLLIAYLRISSQPLALAEKICVKLAFSIYFGWITVATIANATTLLVDLKWDGFGVSATLWTIIILAAGLLIGGGTTWLKKDFAYGLVIIWAYVGILLKHISADGFNGQYLPVIITVAIALAVLALISVLAAIGGKKIKQPEKQPPSD